jgi:hypothetical protein
VFGLVLRALRWHRSPLARARIGLVCLGLLLGAANILTQHYLPQRFDATADRRYTLSRGTREVLVQIDEPIVLRLYYSPALGAATPAYGVYEQRVRLLLEQFATAARGKLQLRVHDIEPQSSAAQHAAAFGLESVPLGRRGERGYFGLAGTNATDDRAVVALFDPTRAPWLADELTALIRALANPNTIGAAPQPSSAEPSRRGISSPPEGPARLAAQTAPRGVTEHQQLAIATADIALPPLLVAVAARGVRRRRRIGEG